MRILKYIFLLLILLAVGISVFIATQKGDYQVTVTKIINTPRNITYGYVNDLHNWPQFAAFDDEMQPEFSAITAGKGASFSWGGNENDGSVKTVATTENDSIVQKMDWNGLPAELVWTFENASGKTKVTLKAKGRIGFMPKIYATLKGGASRIMETMYEKSIATLDKTLDHEINTYKINVDGLTEKTGHFYLYQSITSTIENLPMNIKIMMGRMDRFFKKNNIVMAGKPFVLYDYYDPSKGLTKFSVCVPVRDEVFISPGSDVGSGKFAPFRAVKTTLTGDYSHLKEAWDKTFEYMRANHITAADGDYLELYSVSRQDVKGPSKLVTEIYIPVAAVATPKAAVLVPQPVPKVPDPQPQEQPADEFNL